MRLTEHGLLVGATRSAACVMKVPLVGVATGTGAAPGASITPVAEHGTPNMSATEQLI